MNYQNILTQQKQGIFSITINRPEKLNALNKATLAELHQALHQALTDAQTGAILITGAGDKAFVAGADIKELAALQATEAKAFAKKNQDEVFNLIADAQKPVLAAVNGYALGGGLELAMACHFRFASDNAKMGLPELTLGIIPGYGGTQRLPALVGKAKALEIILSARQVDAVEALAIGLINRIVPAADLIAEAEAFLQQVLKQPASAISAAIKAVNATYSVNNGYDIEIEQFARCFASEDFKEGTQAFLEKRKPNFSKYN